MVSAWTESLVGVQGEEWGDKKPGKKGEAPVIVTGDRMMEACV